MSQRVDAFVVAAPGLEALVLDEVQRLGVRPARAVHGGVTCTATWPQVWAMQVRLRIASRVLVRVGRFGADGFGTLGAGLRRIDWSPWLRSGRAEPLAVRAACDRRSGLHHSGAVAERVAAVLTERGIAATTVREEADATRLGDPHGEPPQSMLVRVVDDTVTISLDASGAPLHRRGWRGPAGRAPVRETLAAALVVASGWSGRHPLVDPFCGSGTVLVEAAMIARRIGPGRHRRFACEAWPSFDAARWERMIAGHDADVLDHGPPIEGSDRDAGAVAAAGQHVSAAGLAGEVEVQQCAVSDAHPPSGGTGWVVSNPPYGVRLAGPPLTGLYDRLGRVLAERFSGWSVALLVPPSVPLARTGLGFRSAVRTSNGGIDVDVAVATVPVAAVG